MFQLFSILTSKVPHIRMAQENNRRPNQPRGRALPAGIWKREKSNNRGKQVVFSIGPWLPCKLKPEQLPFRIDDRGTAPLLRSPERKRGLPDIQDQTSRIKEFRLKHAILFSYVRDLRFVSFLCLILGVTIWWASAPEPLLHKPAAICAPDIGLLCRVVKETFVNHVCSVHQVPSPCECGEPLNQVARDMFQVEETKFDPLNLKKNTGKHKSSVHAHCRCYFGTGFNGISLTLWRINVGNLEVKLLSSRKVAKWNRFFSFFPVYNPTKLSSRSYNGKRSQIYHVISFYEHDTKGPFD